MYPPILNGKKPREQKNSAPWVSYLAVLYSTPGKFLSGIASVI